MAVAWHGKARNLDVAGLVVPCGTCNAEIGAWCRWAPARSLHRCRSDMAEALGFVTVDEMPLMEKADAGVPQLRRARGRSAVSKAVQAGIDLP
jgi:hypothetical protein